MLKTLTRRVVVTGIGVVTPLGCGIEHVWQSLVGGECGIRKITDEIDLAKNCPVSIAGFVPRSKDIEGSFNADSIFGRNMSKEMADFVLFAIHASDLALKSAGYDKLTDIVDANRAGAAIGSGGITALQEIVDSSGNLTASYKKLSPYFVPKVLVNMAAGQVSIRHGMKGPSHSVATACAAGCHSVGDAFNFIRLGYADVMLAGGSDAVVDPLAIAGFARMKALSTNEDPKTSSKPFDKSRDGFVMGEGAAILVLEELETAKKRNAKIIAEIVGYGITCDAYHATSPSLDGDGERRCMEMAMKDANIQPHQIGYVNCHATSTPLGDAIEVNAIKNIFSQRRQKQLTDNNDNESNTKSLSPLYISSTKGATGHLLGAAGAIELAFTAKALQTGIIPLTLNLNDLDEKCSGSIVNTSSNDGSESNNSDSSNISNNGNVIFQHVMGNSIYYNNGEKISKLNESTSVATQNNAIVNTNNNNKQQHELNYALKNSFGFGGTNASLVLAKYKP